MFKVAYWLSQLFLWISIALLMVGKGWAWIALVISSVVYLGSCLGCDGSAKPRKQPKSEFGIMVVGLGIGLLVTAVFRTPGKKSLSIVERSAKFEEPWTYRDDGYSYYWIGDKSVLLLQKSNQIFHAYFCDLANGSRTPLRAIDKILAAGQPPGTVSVSTHRGQVLIWTLSDKGCAVYLTDTSGSILSPVTNPCVAYHLFWSPQGTEWLVESRHEVRLWREKGAVAETLQTGFNPRFGIGFTSAHEFLSATNDTPLIQRKSTSNTGSSERRRG